MGLSLSLTPGLTSTPREEYQNLAREYNFTDLGQGFPDYLPEQEIIDSLVQSANSKRTPSFSKNVKQNIDPYQDVVITVGASGALYSAITGHVKLGDEVIIIEPFFTCYKPIIESVGGIIRYIPLRLKSVNDVLRSSDWVLNHAELESLFNTKTKAIIFNNPHNPYGKVFSLDELEEIANLCKKWNVLCIADEVYEWLVYEPRQHIRMASLPGMWERTITIGSAGKVFLVTGWRVGWAMGPSSLIHKLQVELPFKPATVHQVGGKINFTQCNQKYLGSSSQII
ncbi:hypothetical protein FQA39_LY06375 [Lamprigera yunnana]|nr:hypothetical protein FQA39_LY06375 [Lamprigera yunnana]